MILRKLLICLEMIKFEHSIFALPFAMIGMVWGADGWPESKKVIWIIIAMISCRTAAMLFNRLVDQVIDAKNRRTETRALVTNAVSRSFAWGLFVFSCCLFFLSCWNLNSLALKLSPIALGFTLFYSITKRFTWLCHFILGAGLGIAPMASWIAVRNEINWLLLPLFFAVLFWAAGFDLLYSLQDEEFDRKYKLCSFPARWGSIATINMSRVCHILSIVFSIWMGMINKSGTFYFFGIVSIMSILIYEHRLVKPNDFSRINLAFFTLNGFVSILFFVFCLLDLYFH